MTSPLDTDPGKMRAKGSRKLLFAIVLPPPIPIRGPSRRVEPRGPVEELHKWGAGSMTRRRVRWVGLRLGVACLLIGDLSPARAEEPEVVALEMQPLQANVRRVIEALELLGAPLPR